MPDFDITEEMSDELRTEDVQAWEARHPMAGGKWSSPTTFHVWDDAEAGQHKAAKSCACGPFASATPTGGFTHWFHELGEQA